MSPSFYSNNQYMLGLVNLKMGNKEEAKKWFEKLLKYEVIKEDDAEVRTILLEMKLFKSFREIKLKHGYDLNP